MEQAPCVSHASDARHNYSTPHLYLSEVPSRPLHALYLKLSPTHLRVTVTATKSAFCALHGLHEISIKLTRVADVTIVQKFSFFVLFNLLNV